MKHKKILTGGLAAVAVVGVVTLSLQNSPIGINNDPRNNIDAKSYYENYGSELYGDGSSGYVTSAPNASSEMGSFVKDSGTTSRYGDGSKPTDIPYPYPYPGYDNNFTDYGVSGFVQASVDNESTFALDVDTGSLAVALELAKTGLRVPAESVRSEEWINAFDYGDVNETDKALAIAAEASPDPQNSGKTLVRVNVAGEVVEPGNKNLNITLVVDTSGSMDMQNRLGLVKSSVALLAKNLDPASTISIVTFEDQAGVILAPTEVSDTDTILAAIDELRPGGSTNLEAGLQEGYRQANKVFDSEENNIVLLASDGGANVGNVTANTIEDNGEKGLNLVTVGYGMGGYNDSLMEQLADQGDGFYSYLNSYEDVESFFTNEINKVTTPVAADAKTQVTFDPEVVESYRLVGYDNRAIADEDFDQNVDAGEFGSGHNATALYEVNLRPGVEVETLGEAVVRWTNVDSQQAEEASTPIVLSTEASDKMLFTDLVADVAEYVKTTSVLVPVPRPGDPMPTEPMPMEEDGVMAEDYTFAPDSELLARINVISETYPEAKKLEAILNAPAMAYDQPMYR